MKKYIIYLNIMLFGFFPLHSQKDFTKMYGLVQKKIQIKKQIVEIRNMIFKITDIRNNKHLDNLSFSIWKATYSRHLSAKLVVAIIDAESDFKQASVSKTGDISIAQINPKVWNKELKRRHKKLFNMKLLRKSEDYAIKCMTSILKELHDKFGKKDKYWYCRYHSKNHKSKMFYLKRIKAKLKLI